MEFHDGIAARTIWGEARGEHIPGLVAVAYVIRNRVRAKYRGNTVAAVCLARAQFSCWLSTDPNRQKMLDLSDNDPMLERCLGVWASTYNLPDMDPTAGSTHYQRVGTNANWSRGMTPAAVIGHHEFYKGVA